MHEPSCFVALPRGLLDTLYEQQPALPLPLELTPVRGDTASPSFFLGLGSWGSSAAADTEAGGTGPPLLVAWGGAAATGTALDVPAALADCHGLTDGTLVTLARATEGALFGWSEVPWSEVGIHAVLLG